MKQLSRKPMKGGGIEVSDKQRRTISEANVDRNLWNEYACGGTLEK